MSSIETEISDKICEFRKSLFLNCRSFFLPGDASSLDYTLLPTPQNIIDLLGHPNDIAANKVEEISENEFVSLIISLVNLSCAVTNKHAAKTNPYAANINLCILMLLNYPGATNKIIGLSDKAFEKVCLSLLKLEDLLFIATFLSKAINNSIQDSISRQRVLRLIAKVRLEFEKNDATRDKFIDLIFSLPLAYLELTVLLPVNEAKYETLKLARDLQAKAIGDLNFYIKAKIAIPKDDIAIYKLKRQVTQVALMFAKNYDLVLDSILSRLVRTDTTGKKAMQKIVGLEFSIAKRSIKIFDLLFFLLQYADYYQAYKFYNATGKSQSFIKKTPSNYHKVNTIIKKLPVRLRLLAESIKRLKVLSSVLPGIANLFPPMEQVLALSQAIFEKTLRIFSDSDFVSFEIERSKTMTDKNLAKVEPDFREISTLPNKIQPLLYKILALELISEDYTRAINLYTKHSEIKLAWEQLIYAVSEILNQLKEQIISIIRIRAEQREIRAISIVLKIKLQLQNLINDFLHAEIILADAELQTWCANVFTSQVFQPLANFIARLYELELQKKSKEATLVRSRTLLQVGGGEDAKDASIEDLSLLKM